MAGIGLRPEELVLRTWGSRRSLRYLADLGDVSLLHAQTVAIVGDGRVQLRERLARALPEAVAIDGRASAERGLLRIHAQQAARRGRTTLVVTDPFAVPSEARDLAVADLAGLGALGMSTIVDVADPALALRLADRVVVADRARAPVAYPVVAAVPRRDEDLLAVQARLRERMAG